MGVSPILMFFCEKVFIFRQNDTGGSIHGLAGDISFCAFNNCVTAVFFQCFRRLKNMTC